MSIGPKGKTSKRKRNQRRASSWRISMPNLVVCDKCGEYMVPHVVCKSCGSYNNREVLKLNEAK